MCGCLVIPGGTSKGKRHAFFHGAGIKNKKKIMTQESMKTPTTSLAAEKIISNYADIMRVLGIIISVIFLGIGLYLLTLTNDDSFYRGLVLIFIGILLLIFNRVIWAFTKVISNISINIRGIRMEAQVNEEIVDTEIPHDVKSAITTLNEFIVRGASMREDILTLLTDYCTSREVAIDLIKAYEQTYGTDLISALTQLSDRYDEIKKYVGVFIDFGIVEQEYPHNLKVPIE
jgi:hypothetical protein